MQLEPSQTTVDAREVVTVYFDYLCPFAWRGAEVAEHSAAPLGLHFKWKHFSLYQNNNKTNGWQLWNETIDPLDESGTKGLLPFLASCSARQQGRELFDTFRLNVMRARHRDCLPLTLKTLMTVAQTTGLNLSEFEKELNNPEARTRIAQEHHAAKALGVFGTPTFHLVSGHLAYLRMSQLPATPEEAVQLFSDYRRLLETYPYLETIKRPRPERN
ncbi:MAG: DsbA family oxidoreductase [Trueperaceae bacterium]